MTERTIRPATHADLPRIEGLFRNQLNREPNHDLITDALTAPSVVCIEEGIVVGFAYCNYWAPDIIELLNILVDGECRSEGLGTAMLEFVERTAPSKVKAIILNNSDGYTDVTGKKQPATAFYVRNGYRVIATTADTRVFWKDL